jgi:hypothetical protein
MIPSCEISSGNFVTSYLKEDGKRNQLLVSYDFICTPFVPRTYNHLILNTSYFLRGKMTLMEKISQGRKPPAGHRKKGEAGPDPL